MLVAERPRGFRTLECFMACVRPYPSSLGHHHLISDLSPPRPSSLFPSHHQRIFPTRYCEFLFYHSSLFSSPSLFFPKKFPLFCSWVAFSAERGNGFREESCSVLGNSCGFHFLRACLCETAFWGDVIFSRKWRLRHHFLQFRFLLFGEMKCFLG